MTSILSQALGEHELLTLNLFVKKVGLWFTSHAGVISHLERDIPLSPRALRPREGWQSVALPSKLSPPRVVRVGHSSHAGARLFSICPVSSWAPQLEDQYQKVCSLAIQLLAPLFHWLLNLLVHLCVHALSQHV